MRKREVPTRMRLDAVAALGALVVIAIGVTGSASSATIAGGNRGAQLPRAISLPTLSGHAKVGQLLKAHPGTWRGPRPLRFAYRWHRCAPSAVRLRCTTIPRATHTTYKAVAADLRHTLRFEVIASNSAGHVSAMSKRTAIVQAMPPAGGKAPKNTIRPTISGVPKVGESLSAAAGSWSGTTPIRFAYQWRRCAGATCNPITGAVTRTYSPTANDINAAVIPHGPQTPRIQFCHNLHGVFRLGTVDRLVGCRCSRACRRLRAPGPRCRRAAPAC